MSQLDGIALFVRTVEAGSFAAAARVAGLTASAVAKAVSRLEAHLGVQLLRRTTRALEPTEDGRALFERCRGPIAELAVAETILGDRRVAPQGCVRMSMPVVFGARIVAPLLPALMERHRALRVEATLTDRLSDLVEDGLDLVIRTGALPDSALVSRPLLRTRFVTAVSPVLLERHGMPRTLQELPRDQCLKFVLPRTGRVFAWPFVVDGRPLSLEPEGVLALDNADALIATAVAGGGFVHLQDYMLASQLASGALVEVLRPFSADGGPVTALYLPNRHLSPNIRAVTEYLVKALARFQSN